MQRRTALITAASIVAVVLTGATAVGANIGILSSAEDSSIGELNAATDLVAPTPQVIDVVVDDMPTATAEAKVTPTVGPDGTTATTQDFDVDGAGTVMVVADDGTVRIAGVAPADGWTWTATQENDRRVRVHFESGDTTLEFVARLDASGAIVARVDQPIVETVQAPPVAAAPVATAGSSYDDDDDDEYEDDDDQYEDEHEDEDDDEHEGRDDDD